MAEEAERNEFCGVNPIFRVSDLKASTAYYVEKLGFKLLWGTEWMVCVARGKAHIFLCKGDQGHFGGWVWIGVEGDVEAVHREYVASGAVIRNPPTNYEWALEIQVSDLDGNVLRIGSDSKAGEPYGPWLDMDGVRWQWSDGGVWTREVTQETGA